MIDIDIGFMKAAKIMVEDNILVVNIKIETDEETEANYKIYRKFILEDAVKGNDKVYIDLINRCINKNAEYYYKLDPLESGIFKFIDLELDFRDEYYPYIFDDIYTLRIKVWKPSYGDQESVTMLQGVMYGQDYRRISSCVPEQCLIIFSSKDIIDTLLIHENENIKIIIPKLDDHIKVLSQHDNNEQDNKRNLLKSDQGNCEGSVIYVLSNDYMNVIKIGHTKNIKDRIQALSHCTAVPGYFKLEYSRTFKNVLKAERVIKAHYESMGLRVPKKEFFNVSVKEAIDFISNLEEN